MSASKPALTVLMTVRDGEPYLREAVESILKQTFQDFHFLVLDNASTDSSREVIRGFDDGRIELVELPEDVGQTAALNRGLQMIETPWVARIDADDVSLPGRLEMQMSYLRENPGVVLLGAGVRKIDGSGRTLREVEVAVDDVELRWRLLVHSTGFAHSAVVFHAGAARKAGGYAEELRHAQDYGLWCCMARSGRIANIPDRLVFVREHGSNVTDPVRAEQEVRKVLQKQLVGLFPSDRPETLEDVGGALRYDPSTPPTGDVIHRLQTLPSRFEEASGGRASTAALRDYALRWLQMARLGSLHRQRRAAAWIGLAVALRPALVGHPRFWLTLGSLAMAPIRRKRAHLDAVPNAAVDR